MAAGERNASALRFVALQTICKGMLLLLSYYRLRGFPDDLDGTESAWFDPWVGKSPWRRE